MRLLAEKAHIEQSDVGCILVEIYPRVSRSETKLAAKASSGTAHHSFDSAFYKYFIYMQ